MPQLRDFIGRFRPAAAPADRGSGLAGELEPVLGLLAHTDAACDRIVAGAREAAAKIAADADRQVSDIEAAARRRAQAAREEAVEQVLISARDETRHAMDEAAKAVSGRHEPDEWQVKKLIDEARNLVLSPRGTGPR